MPASKSYLGLDIGSRTTKIVHLANGRVVEAEVFDTALNPLDQVRRRVDPARFDGITATGYGRHAAKAQLGARVVSEIKACALGAVFVCPGARVALDVGGQDFKVIEMMRDGRFGRFELNDRCAAGTGRFLEVMAMILGYKIEDFGREALSAPSSVEINSMCTVFAESEVVTLLASGEDRKRIALGLHRSIVDRLFPPLSKFGRNGPVVMAGGVALNPCVVELLNRELKLDMFVPDKPQLIPAIGAALIAFRESAEEQEAVP
jgi:predicted CoA-substrate-specific enzyme activase